MGTLPSTKLLLTQWGYVRGHFDNYRELGSFLDVNVTKEGNVYLLGRLQTVSYKINLNPDDYKVMWSDGFKQEEAVADYCRTRLVIDLPKEYRVYRYLSC